MCNVNHYYLFSLFSILLQYFKDPQNCDFLKTVKRHVVTKNQSLIQLSNALDTAWKGLKGVILSDFSSKRRLQAVDSVRPLIFLLQQEISLNLGTLIFTVQKKRKLKLHLTLDLKMH